jgi:hypothetical protein
VSATWCLQLVPSKCQLLVVASTLGAGDGNAEMRNRRSQAGCMTNESLFSGLRVLDNCQLHCWPCGYYRAVGLRCGRG